MTKLPKLPKLPVVQEFEYDPEGSYRNANPYVIVFVYPRKSSGYIVKGGLNDVLMYVDINEKRPSVLHIGMFKHGKVRDTNIRIKGLSSQYSGYCRAASYPIENRKTYTCDDPDDPFKSVVKKKVRNVKRCSIIVFKDHEIVFEKKVRQIPRKWIKELDQFI